MTNTFAVGNTVYYRSDATSGSFTVTASSTDSHSGIGSYTFGSAGGGWVSTPGVSGVNTYSWAAGSPVTTNPTVSATNGAGLVSTGNPTITLTPDITAPSGGSVDATGLVGTGGRYSTSTDPDGRVRQGDRHRRVGCGRDRGEVVAFPGNPHRGGVQCLRFLRPGRRDRSDLDGQ
jgi:hypothetical protein